MIKEYCGGIKVETKEARPDDRSDGGEGPGFIIRLNNLF